MLIDAYRWKPIEFSALRIGMTFERGASQQSAEAATELIQGLFRDFRK
jgi:hypothetical protein